jgi:Cu+-exporting ATPase
MRRLIAAVRRAGYDARESRPRHARRREGAQGRRLPRRAEALLDFRRLTLPLVAQMGAMFTGEHRTSCRAGCSSLLATPVQFWIGWRFYVGAYNACAAAPATWTCWWRSAPAMAWAFSAVVTAADLHHQHVYFEASAAVITLVLMGKLLEARAKAKTSAAIEALIRLQPQTARVVRATAKLWSRCRWRQPESRRRLRRAAGRERAGRRRGGGGRLQRQRSHAHRREPAGGQGTPATRCSPPR